jgi:aspartyl-tRNA(Asn)/glutamyl-tRNA(Gln) amidotransferase subunit A
MSDPCALGIAALTTAYAAGELDPVSATEAYILRIAREDGVLHSYITIATDTARAAAEESRGRWRKGRALGALDGVPLALKDNIDVAGLPCTAGTAALRNSVPEADAPVVAHLKRQGAVLLGKLNMHEGALGATTDNAVYGRCMNPLKLGYTPGGSSGGSGAAVAAQLCAAALGTDTMGSVRVPAAYCGVFGFKPSNGAVSTEGVVPLSFTLDSVGPIARSVEDIEILAHALLEQQPRTRRAQAGPDAMTSLAGIRVGVPQQLDEISLEPAVKSAFARFLDALRASGAVVAPVDLVPWQPSKVRRAGLLISEAEGELYYTARLGADLPGLSAGLATMLKYPAQAGLSRVIAAYALIESVRVACVSAFAEIDLLALPTTPQMSFPHGAEVPVNQADCTALANFARAPAITLPFASDPLPIGMQLMAAPGDDLRLLAIAAVFQRFNRGAE